MVILNDIFDVDLLDQMIEQGCVTRRFHNVLPLAILNYSPSAQYSRVWNEVTRACRGLIYNIETLEVVARPFPKFHNWDESGVQYPPSGPCVRMNKMDGSLGILYPVSSDDVWSIATRGSFHSEQAAWATEFFRRQLLDVDGLFFFPKKNKTYLYEIIYSENRIVVDYGDYEGLVLLDVIDNESGLPDMAEFDNCYWPDKVSRIATDGFNIQDVHEIPAGDEGFVYLWPVTGFRTKMKAPDYVILHRLISNLNEKTIWEQLCVGKSLNDIKRNLPEEFWGFIDEKGMEIIDNATDILHKASTAYHKIADQIGTDNRGNFARALMKDTETKPYASYCFAILDKKPMWPICLKAARPGKVTDLTHESL